jgi:hypothetical protein
MYKQAPTNIWNVANRGKRAHGVDMAGMLAGMLAGTAHLDMAGTAHLLVGPWATSRLLGLQGVDMGAPDLVDSRDLS